MVGEVIGEINNVSYLLMLMVMRWENQITPHPTCQSTPLFEASADDRDEDVTVLAPSNFISLASFLIQCKCMCGKGHKFSQGVVASALQRGMFYFGRKLSLMSPTVSGPGSA